MIELPVITSPLAGRTYSLYGSALHSNDYYSKIAALVDRIQQTESGFRPLLKTIEHVSRSKHRIKKYSSNLSENNPIPQILSLASESLGTYTEPIHKHLAELRLNQRLDRTLAATEEQYHLSMVEIELTNRLNRQFFLQTDIKLAFLPHCLHDLEKDCRAAPHGIDYTCKGCSNHCYLNALSKLLRRNGIQPYIWRSANLRRLFKRFHADGKSVGVLGVACIIELTHGMRLCRKASVPVIGLPLDANRCARWMGKFHPTSVNLDQLHSLLS
jgi:hypothetical protein